MRDLEKETPYFETKDFKWYVDDYFTNYLKQNQADNLPSIKNTMCFIVVGKDDTNYVVIDNKQNVLLDSHYGLDWSFETMKVRIQAYKINKHFDKNE